MSTRRKAREAILAALDGPSERRGTPLSYRLSLMLVSFVVVLMPLIYVAIVALIGWGLFWYGMHAGELLADVDSARLYVLGRFGPLVAGGILFFFLLKPLLARPATGPEPTSLDPRDEPFLFEFVEHLARRLNAPVPERIDVDLDVNASASFASGLGSLVDGKVALTLGLPLTSGLKLRELTAVLAHEFGHFSQGAGMRFYYLTQMVNRWFARVVFQRDAWDETLERWSKQGWWVTVVLFNVARACVWASRKLLFLLLKVASAASSLMSRQMEFDADQNAIHLCGSRSFVRSMQLLPQIEAANQWAGAVNDAAFSEGRLSDDVPYLVRQGLEGFSEEVRAELVAQALDSQVGMYSTHPPTGERTARAEALDTQGSFTINGPTSLLFDDYAGLCRQLTSELYEAVLGDAYDASILVAAKSVHSQQQDLQDEVQWTNEYFLGMPLGPTTLALEAPEPTPAADVARHRRRLENMRGETLDQRKLLATAAELEEAESRLARATAASELMARRFPVRDEEFASASKGDVQAVIETTKALSDEIRGAKDLAAVFRHRVALTLDLLATPEVQAKVEDGASLLERATRAADCLAALPAVSDQAFQLARRLDVVQCALAQLEGAEEAATDRYLASHARRLAEILEWIREAAGELPYPFEHRREGVLLADYLVEAVDAPSRFLAAQGEAAQRTRQAWSRLLYRLLGNVARACLETEASLGFEPLRLEAGVAEEDTKAAT